MQESAGRSSSRVPPIVIVVVFVAAFFLCARQARLHEYLTALWEQGVFRLVPPFWRMTAQAFLTHVGHFALAAWLTSVFAGTGVTLLRRLGLHGRNGWESLALAFGLSTGVWAHLFLFLGLLGFLNRTLLCGLLILATPPALWALWRLGREFRDDRSLGIPWAGPVLGWGGLAAAQLFLLTPYVFVPETFYDSLEYHLGLPSLYLLRGGIGPVPDNSFSGVPSTPEMLYGWALAVDPQGVVAHLLNFSFLAWIMLALFGLAGRFGSRAAGLTAGALYALIPAVASVSYMTTVELPWSFYQLLCLAAFLSAAQSPSGEAVRNRWLVTCGVFLGLAMTTKYLAWSLPLAVALMSLVPGDQEASLAQRLRRCGAVLAVGALVLLPWVLKNVAFYRNPVFPFFHEIWVPDSEVMPGWRYLGSGATFEFGRLGLWGYAREYLLAPWRMIFYMEKPSDSLGPAVLASLPLLVLVRFDAKERLLALFALGCWLPLSVVVHLPRYFVPALAPLCLLIGLAFHKPLGRRWSGVITVLAIAGLAAQALSSWRWDFPTTRWDAFLGRESFEDLLIHSDPHYYPSPLYPAAQYVNQETSPGAKVLVFGDSRGFYLMRDYLASTPMQASVLERWANSSTSGGELKARLEQAGITHIVVNHADIVRQNLELRFSPPGKRSLDDFWRRYTLKMFQAGPDLYPGRAGRPALDRWVVVYRVLTEEESLQDHPRDDLFEKYKIDD